ncbi:class I SAM-dependent methyltransferase [Altererythrobacter sp. GH1-8]|uniref:class I SAM-dependent methyltransferase n=1 Tax=Altererythrobacter sp. GH1-8 TaxID=3349333 RepID=UPI00374DDD4E
MPDTVTASEEYARRFSGDAGAFLLGVQDACVGSLLDTSPALERASSVLDHAGTHGQLARLLERRGYFRTVSASSDLVDRACTNSPKIVGPLNAVDRPDGSFDAVVCVRLLAHVSDIEASVREMCRLARVSVIVDYPSLRSVNMFSRWLFKYKKRIERNTREFVSISDTRLRQIFEDNGFALVRIERQFFIPMALHRAMGDTAIMRFLERSARTLGLVKLFGNPVTARFDRITQV